MIIGRYLTALDDLLFAAGQEIFDGADPVVVNAIPVALGLDTLVLGDAVALDTAQYLIRMVAYLDGAGPAGEDQLLRGVVYSNGIMVAASDDVTVPAGQAGGWVTLPFPDPGVRLAVGSCQFGVHGGAADQGARYYRDDIAGGTTTYTGHPFADGPPASFSGGTRVTEPPLFYLETLAAIAIPAAVSDEYIAALPFDVAQRTFQAAGVSRASSVSATVGWYGTAFDPHRGASAIVRSDGPLAGLLGRRILVTRHAPTMDRQVAVYVHDQREFPDELVSEDILLSARAFLALGDQALDSLDVTVGTLA